VIVLGALAIAAATGTEDHWAAPPVMLDDVGASGDDAPASAGGRASRRAR
jgi:hypothetical protein